MYFESRVFELVNTLERGEYERCTFVSCELGESNLSGVKFIDCTFERCNLSMAKLDGATFQDAVFKDSKMLGLRFDTINPFGLAVQFEACQLNHSSFFRLKLRKTKFKNCQMEGVDFGECDLTDAVFDNSNLLQAVFDSSILEKSDFRTAYNVSLDPERNKLKKARFAQSNIGGLLDKYQIQIDRLL